MIEPQRSAAEITLISKKTIHAADNAGRCVEYAIVIVVPDDAAGSSSSPLSCRRVF